MNIFLSSVKFHDGTTAVELIVSAKTLLTNVYAIESKSSLNIDKVLQDHFCEHEMIINIWSDISQEEFMGSVHNLLYSYRVRSKQYEAHNITRTLMDAIFSILKATISLSLIFLVQQAGTGSYAWPMLSQYSTALVIDTCLGVPHTRLHMDSILMSRT